MTYGVWKTYSIEVSALGFIVEVDVTTDEGLRYAVERAQEEGWRKIMDKAGGPSTKFIRDFNAHFRDNQEAVESIRMNKCYKKEEDV
jgi:hypothetical protein